MRLTEKELKGIHGIDGYVDYSGEPYNFEYPSNWSRNRGGTWAKMTDMRIMGPMGTSLSIHLSEKRSFPDVKSFVDSSLDIRKKDDTKGEFKIISRKDVEFSSCPAVEVEYSYKWLKHVKEGQEKEWRCRQLIVDHGDYFYLLVYSSTESIFPKYLEAYDRLKSSFRFLE